MKVVRALSICTFLLSLVAAAGALNPDRDIHQLAHRTWGEKDGYPGRSEALAQTADGFLWLGSGTGLFRFDGVHFERYEARSGDQLPAEMVHSLLVLSDGSLWVAYDGDTICDLRKGNVKCYGKAEGIATGPRAIVQDREGTIWANTQTGVIRFNGTRWEHIGKNWNFPEEVPRLTSGALYVDRGGTLWAGINNTVLYIKQGSKRFEPTGAFAGWSASIAEAPDGTIWLADADGYVRAISTTVSAKSAAIARCEAQTLEEVPERCPSEGPLVVKISAPARLLFDRTGSLWITTDTSGVFRVPHPERLKDRPISMTSDALQRFTSKDGLSADDCNPILEDREGNIWVATRDGLDQFRDTALIPVALPTSIFHIGIAPADGGDVLIAASWKYVARIHGDSKNVSQVSAKPEKAYQDPSGVTWFKGRSLAQWKDGKFRIVAPPPGQSDFSSRGYWQIVGDKSGTLWAFSDGLGFFTLDHGRWKAWATPPEVAKQRVADMFSDSTGLIWVSTYQGDIITMDKGKVVDYPARPDNPIRYVTSFAEHAPHEIWAGGAGGLVLIHEGHFRLIRPTALGSFKDVTGVVDAGWEGLWLNATTGVIHISRDEADRALQDANYHCQWERFDSSDGLPGRTPAIGRYASTYPTAIEGTDGRIWFTATKGVAWVDPRNIPRNVIPPPVSITSVSADGSRHLQLTDLRLPAHTANIQIDYSALSLSVPERVRFRYKLEGIDKGWQDVGTRRQAYYNNLGPGSFQFRVIACNNDGVWNETGATLNFFILPAYYQTTWFRLLCGAAFLLLLWALYQLRLHQLRHQLTIGAEARVNERTRVARELHDTLLQSFQGAVFQFQAARKLLLRNADNAMQVVDDAIQAAEGGIAEGRAAIHDLRPEPAAQRDLPELLKATGGELADTHQWNGNAPTFEVVVEGRPQDLSLMFQDEVYRISREVIRNAFAHAAASNIEVEIRYDRDQLRVRIRDDGKGIDPKILAAGGQPGHWGISGMRERAQRIGSRLDFWSEMGAGTEVQLTVPAAMAYEKRRPNRRFRLLHRAGSDE